MIDPVEIVREYGADALRYYLLRHIPPLEDGDFTMEEFKRVYNASLANGLGNLVSRIMKMATTHLSLPIEISSQDGFPEEFTQAFEEYNSQKALDVIFREVEALDLLIQRTEPFKLVKVDPEKGREIIRDLAERLYAIARTLSPFLPKISEGIVSLIREHKMPEASLFPRKE